MWQPDPSLVEARERGLQRLRAWTTAGALLAAGLAVVFALLAAGTFPGHDAAATGSGSAARSSGDQAQAQQPSQDPGLTRPQPPASGFFGSGGGTRGGRSGGS